MRTKSPRSDVRPLSLAPAQLAKKRAHLHPHLAPCSDYGSSRCTSKRPPNGHATKPARDTFPGGSHEAEEFSPLKLGLVAHDAGIVGSSGLAVILGGDARCREVGSIGITGSRAARRALGRLKGFTAWRQPPEIVDEFSGR